MQLPISKNGTLQIIVRNITDQLTFPPQLIASFDLSSASQLFATHLVTFKLISQYWNRYLSIDF